jgi:hypothetical protein
MRGCADQGNLSAQLGLRVSADIEDRHAGGEMGERPVNKLQANR